ncbi:polysaccharide biosynthesis tyrosine autokinase [Frigoribacterium sp. PvP032]|uniref:polysaccharide biosynthesis tyrosine autokinase n=1 Tax=Frigoribacterium sp. PvP032 TaxID=2806589 RepID=UPI001AE3D1D1|nr:polysaccharide biosynthesis tyrosine autokinase [Frigoribacterium sp. PvP032]MBP1191901.1 capsular exopolysaccharide synthesis family protein [Frigoribacterium sp. PvP032]
MDPQHYWRALVRSWPLVVVLAIVGAIGSWGWSQTQPDSYRATSSVFVAAAEGASPTELLQGSTYTQNLVQSYTRLATTSAVLGPVIADLDLDTTPARLARQITAENPLNTVIIDVAVVDGDAVQAATVANAVTASLTEQARRLSPENSTGVSTLSVTPVATATAPQSPVGPNRRLITLTGLVAGGALGVALALLRSVLDTRLRSAREVDELRLAPVLGSISRRPLGQNALAVDPRGVASDDFRRVRAQIQFADVDAAVRSITLSSSSAHDEGGRAPLALDLALAFAEQGLSVLIVDADLRGPGLASVAAVSDEVGLTDVVLGRRELAEAVVEWREGVDLLPSGEVPPNPSPVISSAATAELLEAARDAYDVVVVDAPPVVSSSDALELGRMTDGVVLVTTVGRSLRRDLVQAVDELQAVQVPIVGIVLDGVRAGKARTATAATPSRPAPSPAELRRRERALTADQAAASSAQAGDEPVSSADDGARASVRGRGKARPSGAGS